MCTPTQAKEDSCPLSHFGSAKCSRCMAPSPLACGAAAEGSKTVARWRRFVRLLTFFKDERTAFSQASQSLKFFAARRVHLLAFASAGSESALRTPAAPSSEHALRAPRGWGGCRLRRPARFSSQGSIEEASSGPGGTEAEGCARVGPPGLHGARARHRFRCNVGSAGPELSYEYAG